MSLSTFILSSLVPSLLHFVTLSPDYKTGFGGKFGVQSDRVDKSALGWEHHEKVDKHESQKGECVFLFYFSFRYSHEFPHYVALSRLQNWLRW